MARESGDDTLPRVNAPDELGRLAPEDLRTLTSDPLTLEQRDDLPSFVPSLPATDFVAAARGLQGEDRLELILPHASPEQLTERARFGVYFYCTEEKESHEPPA